jgi:hypothetical protein
MINDCSCYMDMMGFVDAYALVFLDYTYVQALKGASSLNYDRYKLFHVCLEG